MLHPSPEPFDWDALEDKNVQPSIRNVITMMDMDTPREPLDLHYLQTLVDRLQEGINRAWRTEEYSRHEIR